MESILALDQTVQETRREIAQAQQDGNDMLKGFILARDAIAPRAADARHDAGRSGADEHAAGLSHGSGSRANWAPSLTRMRRSATR